MNKHNRPRNAAHKAHLASQIAAITELTARYGRLIATPPMAIASKRGA